MECPECGHRLSYHFAEGCFWGPSDIHDASSRVCSCGLNKSEIQALVDAAEA